MTSQGNLESKGVMRGGNVFPAPAFVSLDATDVPTWSCPPGGRVPRWPHDQPQRLH